MMRQFIKYLTGAVLLLCVVWAVLLFTGLFTIDKLPLAPNEKDLRIVSMNVSAGNVLDNKLQNDLIVSNPDIIVIIEWTGDNLNLARFDSAGYKPVLNHPRKKVHGICILSKIPGQAAIIEAPITTPCTLPLGQFRFIWKGKPLSLFAVHAPPPVPACGGTTNDYLIAVSGWFENGKLNQNVGIGKQGDPVILAGDFNSFVFEKGISSIRNKGFRDSYSVFNFAAQTWKPFVSFPYVAKIDYILFSNTFTSLNTYRFNIEHSDHLGLITDLDL